MHPRRLIKRAILAFTIAALGLGIVLTYVISTGLTEHLLQFRSNSGIWLPTQHERQVVLLREVVRRLALGEDLPAEAYAVRRDLVTSQLQDVARAIRSSSYTTPEEKALIDEIEALWARFLQLEQNGALSQSAARSALPILDEIEEQSQTVVTRRFQSTIQSDALTLAAVSDLRALQILTLVLLCACGGLVLWLIRRAFSSSLAVAYAELRQRASELEESQASLTSAYESLSQSEGNYRQLFEHTQSVLAETDALYRIAETSAQSADLESFYRAIHQIVGGLMDARNFYIALPDWEAGLIRFPYSVDERGELRSQRPLRKGLTEYVLSTGEAQLISGARKQEMKDSGLIDPVGQASVEWLGVPLKRGAEVFGALAVQTYNDRVHYSARDKEVLTFVSQHIATAMIRKQLDEELRRYREQLEEQVEARTAEVMQANQELQVLASDLTEKNEWFRHGLQLAQDIQLGLLPDSPPWSSRWLAVQGCSIPATEIGGDFYSYIELDEDRLAVAVGDISGKGIAAALMMALTSSTLEAQVRLPHSPAELLAQISNQLLGRLRNNHMNAALLYTIFDQRRQTLLVANAGMVSPLLLRDGKLEFIEAHGLPLGVLQDCAYEEIELKLRPGDLILLISDGIVEAHNPQRVLFGFEQLEQALLSAGAQSPEAVIDHLLQVVMGWIGMADQHDDMTLIAIQPQWTAEPGPEAQAHVWMRRL